MRLLFLLMTSFAICSTFDPFESGFSLSQSLFENSPFFSRILTDQLKPIHGGISLDRSNSLFNSSELLNRIMKLKGKKAERFFKLVYKLRVKNEKEKRRKVIEDHLSKILDSEKQIMTLKRVKITKGKKPTSIFSLTKKEIHMIRNTAVYSQYGDKLFRSKKQSTKSCEIQRKEVQTSLENAKIGLNFNAQYLYFTSLGILSKIFALRICLENELKENLKSKSHRNNSMAQERFDCLANKLSESAGWFRKSIMIAFSDSGENVDSDIDEAIKRLEEFAIC